MLICWGGEIDGEIEARADPGEIASSRHALSRAASRNDEEIGAEASGELTFIRYSIQRLQYNVTAFFDLFRCDD